MAKDAGLSLDEVFGKGRKGKGTVAVKYRDPKNAENTWTGRGAGSRKHAPPRDSRQLVCLDVNLAYYPR
jgi:hypothetical protein